VDPNETWLEKWLLHELNEVYNYWSCVESESNPRIKSLWERFLDYELGHLRFVAELFQSQEGRDVHELIPASLPEPIQYRSHRDFVRQVLRDEVMFSSVGTEYVTSPDQESDETRAYRAQMNADGSPSDTVAAGYVWMPGSEVVAMASAAGNPRKNGRDGR
jgi:hypothetical protein